MRAQVRAPALGVDQLLAMRHCVAVLLERSAEFLPDHAADEVRNAALEIWALIHGFVSLRQHVTALKTEGTDWEDQVVRAVRIHIAALDQTRTS